MVATVARGGSAFALASRANQIRMRLINPPNAVKDEGIDLRRHRRPQVVQPVVQVQPVRIKPLPKPLFVYPKHSVAKIRDVTCEYYGIPVDNVLADCRKPGVALARHVAVYIVRTKTRKSWGEMTPFFAYRDHTTLLHSVKKIDRILAAGNIELQNDIDKIWGVVRENYSTPTFPTQCEQAVAIKFPVEEGLPGTGICGVEETSPLAVVDPETAALSDDCWPL